MPNNVTTENITKKDLIDNIKKTKNLTDELNQTKNKLDQTIKFLNNIPNLFFFAFLICVFFFL